MLLIHTFWSYSDSPQLFQPHRRLADTVTDQSKPGTYLAQPNFSVTVAFHCIALFIKRQYYRLVPIVFGFPNGYNQCIITTSLKFNQRVPDALWKSHQCLELYHLLHLFFPQTWVYTPVARLCELVCLPPRGILTLGMKNSSSIYQKKKKTFRAPRTFRHLQD